MPYLIWASDDLGELALLLILSFDNSFNDARVVRPQVDEAVSDTCFPDGLEEGE
jgi:hypothetical protein